MSVQKIKTKKISWTHIHKATRKEIEFIGDEYKFHKLDLEDCLVRVQRPQISQYHNYLFFILTFPVYNRHTKEIESSEIDFFVGAKYVITFSDGLNPVVNDFFQELQNNIQSQDLYMSGFQVNLVYEILHRLQTHTLPMLDHVSEDIEDVEKRIFKGEEQKVVREILNIKRNIVNLRKIMQAHKNIIKKLMDAKNRFFMPDQTNLYFSNILDRTKDIWDILETQKENINAFQETNESLITNKTNDIMKILTVISVVIIPANLIASIFGMNAKQMPLVNGPYDFFIILSIMICMIMSFLIFFRKKGWL
ncbi:magnesium/cobalt transporter CorA [Patescibacteria group bacterium]|nr:magnesium/cobalt transporter CorA [Patescibacteria group bacterium]